MCANCQQHSLQSCASDHVSKWHMGLCILQGVKNAVPKSILGLMNVDGMTRENVASHLQKYRLYLKKIGGLTSNAKVTPEALQVIQQVGSDCW